jgi:hypothetical protein
VSILNINLLELIYYYYYYSKYKRAESGLGFKKEVFLLGCKAEVISTASIPHEECEFVENSLLFCIIKNRKRHSNRNVSIRYDERRQMRC